MCHVIKEPKLDDSSRLDRLLLWDCDDRRYSFYVEVSTNNRDWVTVCDRSRQPCQSWQNISFSPQPVVYVKIVGTQNTANDVRKSLLTSWPFSFIYVSLSGVSLRTLRVPGSRGRHGGVGSQSQSATRLRNDLGLRDDTSFGHPAHPAAAA